MFDLPLIAWLARWAMSETLELILADCLSANAMANCLNGLAVLLENLAGGWVLYLGLN